jgi:lysophospholipase L1-like esterase
MKTTLIWSLIVGIAAGILLMVATEPAHARGTTYAAVGDSITWGLGTSDPATKAYPVQAGVESAGSPGRCITLRCWGNQDPMVGHFAESIAYLPTRPDVVVFHMGVNDLNAGVAPSDVIAGLKAVKVEGRDIGVRVVFSTITPPGYSDPDAAARIIARNTVNDWVRTHATFVDYARALDNNTTGRMLAKYDSGDGLHPGDLGAAKMADTLDNWISAR